MNQQNDTPEPSTRELENRDSQSWRTDFEQCLIDSASTELPPSDLASRAIDGIVYRRQLMTLGTRQRKLPKGLVAAGSAFAAAALLVVVSAQFRKLASTVEVGREPLGSPAVTASVAPKQMILDPCFERTRAEGRDPFIDDFEDSDDTITPRDGRSGFWRWARDTDAPGTAPALLPNPRPERKPGNLQALHVKGDQLKDWGASVELTLKPNCYDASAYAGIAFSARGPGRIYVALRQVDVIPPEFHGTCEHDCYNAHVRKIDLDERFRDYEVRWTDVEQRGYGKPKLDVTRLHDIAFQIRPEDTPYDVWIDTLRFIER